MGGKKLSHEDKGDGFLLNVVKPGISSFNEFSQCYLENLLEIIYIKNLSLFSKPAYQALRKPL